ncbi:hypothetical protein [Natroniella sp. ANB-PHB2]|uniref:hypothetical protein n=1 Tax=Natroniella sp. ANB-PHB2 TaxID=3384444 RepID=UPI0038D4EC70
MKNYSVKYDARKNRIYATFKDTLKEEEAKDYIEEMKKAADKTKPNFTVCLDISCDPVHSKKTDEIFATGREYLLQKKVKGTATIISKSAMAKLQAKRMLKDMNHNTFTTQADADKYLDSL